MQQTLLAFHMFIRRSILASLVYAKVQVGKEYWSKTTDTETVHAVRHWTATITQVFVRIGLVRDFQNSIINMIQLVKTKIGWLRIIGFLEGISLLALVFVAVPMKHVYNNPSLSESLGPVHGALFILFVLYTLSVSFEQNWRFGTTTWKVLASSFLPFGTFYVDYKILKDL